MAAIYFIFFFCRWVNRFFWLTVGFEIFSIQTTWCSLGVFAFCLFICYPLKCTWIARHLKETVLWINIHGAMGKQNIQAKKVYWPWMSLFSVKFLLNSASAVVVKRTIKTESIRKLSNFNSQWTKPLYQNILSHIIFF